MKGKLQGVRSAISFHSFRHTFRSQLAAKNIPDRIIDAILGHTNPHRKIQEGYEEYQPVDLMGAVAQFTLPRPLQTMAIGIERVAVKKEDEGAPTNLNYLDFLHELTRRLRSETNVK